MVYEVTASVLCFYGSSAALVFWGFPFGNPETSLLGVKQIPAEQQWDVSQIQEERKSHAWKNTQFTTPLRNTSNHFWTVWFSTFIILILSLVLKICMRTHQSEARASRRENTLGKCFPDRWMSWHKPGMDSHIQKCSYFLVRQRHLWGWRSQNTSHYSQWTVKRFSSVTWYLYILNLQIFI